MFKGGSYNKKRTPKWARQVRLFRDCHPTCPEGNTYARHALLFFGGFRPRFASSDSFRFHCLGFPGSVAPRSFTLATPAPQLGLIDESEFERKKKKSQWAGRYSERNQESTMVGAPLAEGEEGDNYEPSPVVDEEEERRRVNGNLWRRGEEEYYGESGVAR